MELSGSPDPRALLQRKGVGLGSTRASLTTKEGQAAHSTTSWRRETFPAHSRIHHFPFLLLTPSWHLASLSLVYIIFLSIQYAENMVCAQPGILMYTQTSRLDGEQTFLPIKIYMKTINIPLMDEISGSLQETVKSSLQENPAGVGLSFFSQH